MKFSDILKNSIGGLIGGSVQYLANNAIMNKQNKFNAQQAELNRQFQSDEAQIARDWNLEMDNTKYQRTVTDMQNAGINPALAMNGGISTQASSNAVSNGSQANASSPLSTDIMSSIIGLATAKANIANMQANTKKTEVETEAQSIENKYADEYNQLRNEGLSLSNNVTVAQERSIYKSIDVADTTINKMLSETKTEESKQTLYAAQEFLDRANAKQVLEMLPYMKALQAANTDEARSIAGYNFVKQCAEKSLLDDGYYSDVAQALHLDITGKEFENLIKENSNLRLESELAKRGIIDTLSNGEDYYEGGFSKKLGTTLWHIGDILSNAMNISTSFGKFSSTSKIDKD